MSDSPIDGLGDGRSRTSGSTSWWAMPRKTVSSWLEDSAPSMGAAIAYYTLFSIAPLLVIAVAVAGFFFGEEAARGEISNQIGQLLGEDGANAVQGLVESARETGEGLVAGAIGIIVVLLGATAVFVELQNALDKIWEAPPREADSGVGSFVRARLLAFGMVLGVAFLLLVSLLVSAGLSALGQAWNPHLGSWELALQLINLVVSLIVFTGAFALIYKFVPRVEIEWRDVWIGAAATAALFVLGKFLIGLYIGKSGVTSGFGAAGSLVALMVWVYYSAQIFLLGAEFTWVYAQRRQSRSCAAN